MHVRVASCQPAANDRSCVISVITHHVYHQQCTQLTTKIFDKFILMREPVGWICDDCKLIASSLKSQLLSVTSKLSEQVAELKCDMETLKLARCTENNSQVQVSSLEGFKLSRQNSDKHLALIVHRTLDDVSRRKRNVVVSGLPEGTTPSDDRQAFLQLCEAHLPIKPVL